MCFWLFIVMLKIDNTAPLTTNEISLMACVKHMFPGHPQARLQTIFGYKQVICQARDEF